MVRTDETTLIVNISTKFLKFERNNQKYRIIKNDKNKLSPDHSKLVRCFSVIEKKLKKKGK